MITFEGRVKAPEIITVAAVGDVLLHDTVQRYAMNQETGFMSLFGPVVDLIQGADVAFANLEGPVAAGVTKRGRVTAPPQRLWDRWVYTGYPMFNYHPSVVRSLKDAGFDVLQTANNHSMDRFAIGADKTIEAIEAEGLKFTG
ncbi:MAG: CapA family protein, partial [Rhodospirillaceae bacterium]|nr:CapA family protein [Rhodospirillaceae bacterium]